MMESELASVIIPCHNRLVELRECLESVIRQTYRPIEVIVVDDASAEDVETTVTSLSWPSGITYQYVRSDKNQGPGASREMGRQLAQGAYITYLDSDDICHEEKLERQVNALKQHPQAGMCYTAASMFSTWPLDGTEEPWGRSAQTFTQILPHLLYGRPWGTGACLWTRRASDLIGPWSNHWFSEDVEYDSRAGCHEIELIAIPEVLFFIRRDDREGARLTTADAHFRAVERTKSVLTIVENLETFDRLKSTEIRQAMSLKLFNQALSLIGIGEKKLFVSCLQKVIQINRWSWLVHLRLRLLAYGTIVLPDTWSLRIGRSLRRRLFVI